MTYLISIRGTYESVQKLINEREANGDTLVCVTQTEPFNARGTFFLIALRRA